MRSFMLALAFVGTAAHPPQVSRGGATTSSVRGILSAAGGFVNSTNINHFCTVVADFDTAAATFSTFFGTLPVAGLTGDYWTWYRGTNTSARAKIVHVPVSDGSGFTFEIIQPADVFPSFWAELLRDEGPLIHHFGVAIEPAAQFDSVRFALDAAGFPTVQMGQGGWGCYAYIDARSSLGGVMELLGSGINCTAPL